MDRRITYLLFALALIVTAFVGAFAAVSSKVLESKITAAKVLPANEKFQVSSQGDEAIISKFKIERSKNADKDSKIEAVLLAKIVMDADPTIKKVRTRFFDKGAPTFSSITVRIGDIKSFAAGSISQTELLGSLDQVNGTDANSGMEALVPVTAKVEASKLEPKDAKVESPPALVVVEGPRAEERKALLGRIKDLQKNGINTSAYEAYFVSIEDAAKKNDQKTTGDMIDKISQNLESQEKVIQRKTQAASAGSGGDSLDDFVDVRSANLDSAMQKAFPKLASLALSTMAVPMQNAYKPKQGPMYFERLALCGHWNTYGGGDNKLFMELEQAARTNSPSLPKMVQAAMTKYGVRPEMVEFSKRIYALKKSQQR